ARDLVVRPHRDVDVPGHDGVLEEPGPSVRIESDIQVTEEVLRSGRLRPLRADEVFVLGGREFRHAATVERDPHAANPTAQPCDRLVEHDRAVTGFHVRDDERLPRGEVRHVLSLIEILLRDDAVLDPGGVADEIARELRAIRMGNLDAPLLCERLRHLAARPHDLLAVHGACREDHLPPRREVEAVRPRTGLRHVSQPEPRTAEPIPLRAAIPFIVVGRRGAVLLPGLPDLRDVGGTGDEHVAVRLPDRLPFMAPDLSELRFRQCLHGPPVGVLVLEEQHRSRARGPGLVDDLRRDRKSMIPTLDDDVLLRLNVQGPADDVLGERFVFGHGRLLRPRSRSADKNMLHAAGDRAVARTGHRESTMERTAPRESLTGQEKEARHLWIGGGSLPPTAPGVNQMMTIMAFAARTARFIHDSLAHDPVAYGGFARETSAGAMISASRLSTWSVTWPIPNRSRNRAWTASTIFAASWTRTLPSTDRWPVRTTSPEVTVHTCRSWTPRTPG